MNLDPSQDAALQNISNPLNVMQPGERVICEIKRHPFGLLGLYGSCILTVIVGVIVVAMIPKLLPDARTQAREALAFAVVLICTIVGLFTYVGVTVYKGNRWVVTSDSITQISQISLFRKQTSNLSLANLEDVTVEQDGVLASMFGFGRLRAETAGERSKFVFDFCPRPTDYARQIVAAHEAYMIEKPDEMRTTNQALASTPAFNQSYAPPQSQYSSNAVQPGQPAAYVQPYQQAQQQPYTPNVAQPYGIPPAQMSGQPPQDSSA